MKRIVSPILFSIISTISGFSQNCLESTTTYEHLFNTFNFSVIVTESCDSNHHCLVLKHIHSGRLDTIGNSLSPGTALNNIAYFGFIDSNHFVLIIEHFHYPYPAKYYVIEINPIGFEQIYSENLISNPDAPILFDRNMTRKGRYNYEVINPSLIKILDKGKPITLLYFDLEQKKLIRTEIKRE